MNDIIKYGFSTGALHQQFTVKESLAHFRKLNFSVVELGFVKKDRIIDEDQLNEISATDLEGFSYVSLHAPAISYGEDEDTVEIFKQIERLHAERSLDLVVIHPDKIKDFKIFNDVTFPVGIENMDSTKASFQSVAELEQVLSEYKNFKAIIDINHIFTNDPSMKLLEDFYDKIGDRIAELHVSGFEKYHEPFIQTKQENIIKAIKDKSVPMINEAIIPIELLEEERDYFLKVLAG